MSLLAYKYDSNFWVLSTTTIHKVEIEMGRNCIVEVVFIGLLSLTACAQSNLKLGFYDQSCPKAEKLIREFIAEHIPNAPSLSSPLLRMHFHDCFVRGCDGSVLLNFTKVNQANETEKMATPNLTLRGFDFIDRLKSLVEEECPGVVSCADIIALAARDSVGVIGGPFWKVPTGRRDGLISNVTEATNDIPAPTFNFTALTRSFGKKGLNVADLVLLSGAHTIGIGHCSSFNKRLYNFSGRGDQDPALDSEYAANLKMFKCRTPNDNASFTEMDPGSFRTFDLGYYKLLLKRRGLFQSDAALTTNPAAKTFITNLLSGPPSQFFAAFAASMEKMGRVEVKTGTQGEIRKKCALVNG